MLELVQYVRVEGNIDIVEMAVAHEIGPADQLLLGRRAEHLERPGSPNVFIADWIANAAVIITAALTL